MRFIRSSLVPLLLLWASPASAAWNSVGTLGSVNDKTAGTTIVLTTTAAAEVGNVILLVIAKDNVATADGNTSEVSSIADGAGNTYVKQREFTNAQGAAAGGATLSIWTSKVTTALSSGSTITATFSSSITASTMTAWEFTVSANAVIAVAATVHEFANDAVANGTTVSSSTISGLTSREYLFVRGIAYENTVPAGGAGTNYTALDQNGTTGGGGATNMSTSAAFRVFTGTGDTCSPTWTNGGDWSNIMIALTETGDPPPTLIPRLMTMGVG